MIKQNKQWELSARNFILQLTGLGLGKTLQGKLSGLDQKEFLTMAAEEGVTGVIHYNLTHYKTSHRLSDESCEYFQQEYLVNMGRNLLINNQLDAICESFEKRKIKTLTVRGAVLFDQIYPDPGVRPMIDIDLVVRRDDFALAENALKELGFDCYACYPFFFFKDNIYVDLHLDSINFWRIKSWPSAIDISRSELWQRTLPFRGHKHVRMLDALDTVIHCSEHLMRHSFERLIGFLDIAYLIRKEGPAFQWDRLLDRAREARAQKAVYYVLSYLNTVRLSSVPSYVLEELGKLPLNFIEKKNLCLLLNNQRADVSGDLLSLFAIPRWGQRLRMLFNGAFIEGEKFPLVRRKLTPLMYLWRFFRLARGIVRKTVSTLSVGVTA